MRLAVLGAISDVKTILVSGDFDFLVLDVGLHLNCPHFYPLQISTPFVQHVPHHMTCRCVGFKETLAACCVKQALPKPSQQQTSPTPHPTQVPPLFLILEIINQLSPHLQKYRLPSNNISHMNGKCHNPSFITSDRMEDYQIYVSIAEGQIVLNISELFTEIKAN